MGDVASANPLRPVTFCGASFLPPPLSSLSFFFYMPCRCFTSSCLIGKANRTRLSVNRIPRSRYARIWCHPWPKGFFLFLPKKVQIAAAREYRGRPYFLLVALCHNPPHVLPRLQGQVSPSLRSTSSINPRRLCRLTFPIMAYGKRGESQSNVAARQ